MGKKFSLSNIPQSDQSIGMQVVVIHAMIIRNPDNEIGNREEITLVVAIVVKKKNTMNSIFNISDPQMQPIRA